VGLLCGGANGDNIAWGQHADYRHLGDASVAFRLRYGSTLVVTRTAFAIESGAGEAEADNSVFYADLQGSIGAIDIRYVHESGAGVNDLNQFDTNLVADTWYNVIIRRDVTANTVEMWLDGSAQTTFNYTNDPTNTNTTCRIVLGDRISSGSTPSVSGWAEFGYWTRKLTDGEVQALIDDYAPIHFPNALQAYAPLIRDAVDLIGKQRPAINGSVTVVAHPRVIYPVNRIYIPFDKQIIRPNADDSVGNWTTDAGGTTNLYQRIDETPPDSADYIQSDNAPSSSVVRVNLSDPVTPLTSGGGVVRFRYYKTGSMTVNLTWRLKEGTTTIKSGTINNISATETLETVTLTSGEVASISDTTNLKLEWEATAV
jgi:hypothetical protein